MAYKTVNYIKSDLTSVDKIEGETIEQKMERVLENGEPISDGAPEIFTEKSAGVVSAYNIRTDRWEIACEAMDSVHRFEPKREEKPAEMKVVEKKDSKPSEGGQPSEGGVSGTQSDGIGA